MISSNSSARVNKRMKIVLARIFILLFTLRERPSYEQKGAAKQRRAPKGRFCEWARLNVTRGIPKKIPNIPLTKSFPTCTIITSPYNETSSTIRNTKGENPIERLKSQKYGR